MVTLGASVFAAIQGVSGARWWAPLRPVTLSLMGAFTIPAVFLAVTLLAGLGSLYEWSHHEAAANHILAAKAVWLNRPLFLARALVVLLIWASLTSLLKSRLSAVIAGEPEAMKSYARASVGFLVVLEPSISVAFWDWVMSLEPEWFSTMFGVYGFAGTFLAGIAAIAATASFLDSRGALPRPLSPATPPRPREAALRVRHVLGVHLVLSVPADLVQQHSPEETPYYALRLQGGWKALFWLNPILNFGIPFVVLLSSKAKKNPAMLGQAALVVLIGRWLDSYVMVAPGWPVASLSRLRTRRIDSGRCGARPLFERSQIRGERGDGRPSSSPRRGSGEVARERPGVWEWAGRLAGRRASPSPL